MNFKNFKPGVLLGLVSMIGLLLVQFGVKVDLAWLNETAELVITILSTLGLFVAVKNNPETKGIDNPLKKK